MFSLSLPQACRRASALALVSLFALAPAVSTGADPFVESSGARDASTASALKTAASFHQFLRRGDSANAVRLLASGATILESGELETRSEYVAHHLGEDIEFAQAVTTTRGVVDGQRQGDVVWVVATSVSKGRFHDRQIDSRGGELMVLTRSGQRWLVRAIHWSSHGSAP
jgi:hypothetical protein